VARRHVLAVAILLGGALFACGDDGDSGASAPTGSTTTEAPAAAGGGDGGGRPATCPEPGDGAVPWEDGPSAELVTLAEGGDGEPRVRAAVHPLPDHEGDPWSQWGQGVVLEDGRSLSAVGDHLGRDGNSYLYELDPEAGRLTLVADVASVAGHEPGDWGYGKVHAQMVLGPCGEVYAATYWGTRDGIEYGGSYQGDVLLRIDPERRTTESLGPVLEEHGVPSLAGWAPGGLLYAEAADPDRFDPQRGAFVVLDMATGERVFATPDEEDHRGFRAMAVDAEGRVLFSRTGGRLARWDPATGELTDLDLQLPGEFLRAATPPAPDGTVYLATEEPEVLLALEPDGTLRELGELRGYTASLALSPEGDRLWYVPGAHGDAPEQGTPLVEVDTATGDERVVVELDPLAREALDLTLGGTYNIAVAPDGTTLHIGFNAAPAGREDTFGQVVAVVVELG
jgi:sugar lactone lactonase YvrE